MTRTPFRSTLRLTREFYRRDAISVARGLLGQRLVHRHAGRRLAGIIVETEAYLGVRDKAAHSYGGRRTRRTETMYADGGTVYVFLNYGMHHLLNVVVGQREVPEAVLIRAIEPTEGIAAMFSRRVRARRETDLCSGPGKLGAAFAIEKRHDGLDLTTDSSLTIEQITIGPIADAQISVTARIGVGYAEEWSMAPLRFFLSENPHVSRGKTKAAESFDSAALLPIAPEE